MERNQRLPLLRRLGMLGMVFGFVLLTASTGCQLRQIHVVVPDFSTSLVQGIDVYRLDEASGQPVYAGQITFGQVVVQPDGSEAVSYAVTEPDGSTTSGLQTTLVRLGGDSVDLRLVFSGATASGDFKVASFNAVGSSPLSVNAIYLL